MPFELKGVKCVSNNDMQTELSTSVGVVGSTEVAEQHDVNSKTLSVPNFDQSSTGKIIISSISTKQSESSARTSEYRNTKKSRQNESREKREVRLEKMRNIMIQKNKLRPLSKVKLDLQK